MAKAETTGMPPARARSSKTTFLTVSPGRLGLTLQLLNGGRGVEVRRVALDSPLRGEVDVGDRIVSIDGDPVDTQGAVARLVEQDRVRKIGILKGDATEAEKPEPSKTVYYTFPPGRRLGLTLQVRCKDGCKWVQVLNVAPKSPLRGKVDVGDRIVSVNGEPVDSTSKICELTTETLNKRRGRGQGCRNIGVVKCSISESESVMRMRKYHPIVKKAVVSGKPAKESGEIQELRYPNNPPPVWHASWPMPYYPAVAHPYNHPNHTFVYPTAPPMQGRELKHIQTRHYPGDQQEGWEPAQHQVTQSMHNPSRRGRKRKHSPEISNITSPIIDLVEDEKDIPKEQPSDERESSSNNCGQDSKETANSNSIEYPLSSRREEALADLLQCNLKSNPRTKPLRTTVQIGPSHSRYEITVVPLASNSKGFIQNAKRNYAKRRSQGKYPPGFDMGTTPPPRRLPRAREKKDKKIINPQAMSMAKKAFFMAEKALAHPWVKKKLLVSMAMERENPRSPLSIPPKRTIIKEGFRWAQFPPLENLLRCNMERYYELDTDEHSKCEQIDFNVALVGRVKELVEEYGWKFDEDHFDDTGIQHRVRCYYRVKTQSAQSRLTTMLRKPEKAMNIRSLAKHFHLIAGKKPVTPEQRELWISMHNEGSIERGKAEEKAMINRKEKVPVHDGDVEKEAGNPKKDIEGSDCSGGDSEIKDKGLDRDDGGTTEGNKVQEKVDKPTENDKAEIYVDCGDLNDDGKDERMTDTETATILGPLGHAGALDCVLAEAKTGCGNMEGSTEFRASNDNGKHEAMKDTSKTKKTEPNKEVKSVESASKQETLVAKSEGKNKEAESCLGKENSNGSNGGGSSKADAERIEGEVGEKGDQHKEDLVKGSGEKEVR